MSRPAVAPLATDSGRGAREQAMKFLSFRHRGKDRYGAVVGEGVVDLGRHVPYPSLKALLAADALGAARCVAERETRDLALGEISYLPVIPNAEKIILAGLNNEFHRKEAGEARPAYPLLFTRFADAHVGHGQPIVKPKASDEFDYEGELALVIGRGGRHISTEQALDHVAGYTCFNDGTARDWEFHTSQYIAGKNFHRSGSFGPWLVTSDEIPDPTRLVLVTRLNGAEVQRTLTGDLIYSIPELIAYISAFTPLGPGDVISAGTPGGTGYDRNPRLFMKPGDVVEVEISGIGTLRNPIVEE